MSLKVDNAATHQLEAVSALCDAPGVRCIFLPPYSYDFNPIELCFHEANAYCSSKWGLANGEVAERMYEALSLVLTVNIVAYYRIIILWNYLVLL
jgi:hypothetical protein